MEVYEYNYIPFYHIIKFIFFFPRCHERHFRINFKGALNIQDVLTGIFYYKQQSLKRTINKLILFLTYIFDYTLYSYHFNILYFTFTILQDPLDHFYIFHCTFSILLALDTLYKTAIIVGRLFINNLVLI